MDARTKELNDILLERRQYVIPEYQRPYVWNPQDHVQQLLEDIEAVAERRLRGIDVADQRHFAGAIVLQKVEKSGYDAMNTWAVVDGQQRMTTLQLIARAAATVAERHGLDPAPFLRFTINESASFEHPDDRWKLWPTWTIRDDWRRLMDPAVSSSEPHGGASEQMLENLEFTRDHVDAWAITASDVDGLTAATPVEVRVRRKLEAYRDVLQNGLQFVVIDLLENENAQIIFETLNGTGARLLAADLVKNHVFRAAEANGESLEELARDIWAPFDTQHWRREIGRGHRRRPRIEYFLQHWLIAETASETANQAIFQTFQERFHKLDESSSVLDDARAFRAAADAYDRLDEPSSLQQRRLRELVDLLGLQTVLPVLLRLELDVTRGRFSDEQRDEALAVLESWIARRMLLRLNTRAYGTTFVEIVEAIRDASGTPADAIRALLGTKTSDTNRWPLDAELKSDLPTLPMYGRLSRQRIAYVLREIEQGLRTTKGEGLEVPRKLSIEHVIPQSWYANWPLEEHDEEGRQLRSSIMHALGNLTVVVQKLNSGLSNAAWIDKRVKLNDNSELMLNRRLHDEHMEEFTNQDALDRGRWLAERAAERWPRTGPEPDSRELELAHSQTVRDDDAAAESELGIDEDDVESVLEFVASDHEPLVRGFINAYRNGGLGRVRLRRKSTDGGTMYLRLYRDGESSAFAYIDLQKRGMKLGVGNWAIPVLTPILPKHDVATSSDGGWNRILFSGVDELPLLTAAVKAIATSSTDMAPA